MSNKRLFCNDIHVRQKQLIYLNGDQLVSAAIVNYHFYKPPSEMFSEEIGRRGEEGLNTLVKYAQTSDNISSEFIRHSIVWLKRYSNIDACAQLRNENRFKKLNSISGHCSSSPS